MEKLEDEQLKERAEYNVGHDMITVDMDINILFDFHIYKGRLFWVENKQKIFVERFRLIPGEKGGELIFTARYDENSTPVKDIICKIVDNALADPVIKKTLDQYKKVSSKKNTNESIELMNKFDYLSQIYEAAAAKNVKTRDIEHDDKLIQTIIKSGSDFYIIVDSAGTAGHYKAVQVYDGASNSFLIKRINDLDLSSATYDDGESEFKELVSKSSNKIFDETGKNGYEAIDMFKHNCLTRFDSLNDKPAEPVEERKGLDSDEGTESAASANNRGIDTTSDDIYGSASIDEYPNIRALGVYKDVDGKYMDIQIQFSCSSLELSQNFGWKKDPIYDITPNMIKNTCLDYREAKKVNLYINGINRRPKDSTHFIEALLPYIHLEFKGISKDKQIKGGKYKNQSKNSSSKPAPAAGGAAGTPAGGATASGGTAGAAPTPPSTPTGVGGAPTPTPAP